MFPQSFSLLYFMLMRNGRWQMSNWHNERPALQYYIDQAHEARAEAMARAAYLATAAIGRVARFAGVELPRAARRALAALVAWRNRRAALREILSLDDRILRDIGLTRADAWDAVDGTLRRQSPGGFAARAYRDVALSAEAIAACNDNGERQRAA